MVCPNCLEYGHTAKRCHESTPICAQCNASEHSLKTCRRSDIVCHHCEDDHRSFTKNCPRYKQDIEIIKTQTRERVSKTEAKQRLLKENPNKMNYAKAAKQTSNTSAIPSTSANSDALDNDLNDTSETNPVLRQEAQEIFKNTELIETNSELREEAHNIFNSTAPTQQNAGTPGYYTKAFLGQKRPASPSDQSPPEKKKRLRKFQNEKKHRPHSKISSKNKYPSQSTPFDLENLMRDYKNFK